MPCSDRQRKYFFHLVHKKRKTKKEKATMKGLGKKCELQKHIRGGDRKMVKRRKCRARTVMVGRNRCAKISCRGKVLKGRVKCGRKKVAGRARHAKVFTKARRRTCRFGKRKGTNVCRKHPKRIVHRKSRRVVHVRARRATRRRVKARKPKIPCGAAHSKCGKTHRKHNKRYSWLRETRN
jgi:hypothetical protein